MLFFAGILVGQRGGVVCVEVEEHARIGILRRAFIDEVNRDSVEKRIQCPADNVGLRVKLLSTGKVPKDLETILSGDPLDPTTFARDICEGPAPEKAVEVLIVTKTDATKDGKIGIASGNKRKPEIEIVDPGKAKKSANIETRNSQFSWYEKKDKPHYKVGDLVSFAIEMARLLVKESEQNNDTLVVMMRQSLNETVIYRSDVKRSVVAALIAHLRKSKSPIVEQTASSLRKHMIKILVNDAEITPH